MKHYCVTAPINANTSLGRQFFTSINIVPGIGVWGSPEADGELMNLFVIPGCTMWQPTQLRTHLRLVRRFNSLCLHWFTTVLYHVNATLWVSTNHSLCHVDATLLGSYFFMRIPEYNFEAYLGHFGRGGGGHFLPSWVANKSEHRIMRSLPVPLYVPRERQSQSSPLSSGDNETRRHTISGSVD